jgi:Ca2+-binding RTX toxin-like protein
MTGSTQALEQGQIATFSEGIGGVAYFANYWLQQSFRDQGYPGIYYLSQQVAVSSLDAIREKLGGTEQRTHNSNTGHITNAEMFASADRAWDNNGVQHLFPGNFLDTFARTFSDAPLISWLVNDLQLPQVQPSEPITQDKVVAAIHSLWENGNLNAQNFNNRALSDGTLSGLIGLLGGSVFGKRLQDFEGRPEYMVVALPDSTYKVVLHGADQKVVGIFNNQLIPTSFSEFANRLSENFQAIVARVIGGPVAGFTASVVTDFLSTWLGDFHRSLSEHMPGFNGDVGGRANVYSGQPGFLLADSPSDTNDTRWGTGGLLGGLYADTLYAGAGDDRLFGGDGNDELHGQAGDDIVYGQSGDDRLFGEAGNDVLRGGAGSDTLEGGDGDDFLDGADITDTVDDNRDWLRGGAGNDTLAGGGGSDVMDGGADNDIMAGGEGIDYVTGGAGNDFLSGDAGNDDLDGGDGDDELDGGADDDILRGGLGRDLLKGSQGEDIYQLLGTDTATDTIVDTTNDGRLFVDGISIGSFTRMGEGVYASDDGQYRLVLIDRDGAVNAGAAGDRRYSAHLIRATDGKRLAEIQGVSATQVLSYSLPGPVVGNPTVYNGTAAADDLNVWKQQFLANGGTFPPTVPGAARIDGGAGSDSIASGTHLQTEIIGGDGNDWIYSKHWRQEYNTAGRTVNIQAGAGSDFLFLLEDTNVVDTGEGNDLVSASRFRGGGASVMLFTPQVNGAWRKEAVISTSDNSLLPLLAGIGIELTPNTFFGDHWVVNTEVNRLFFSYSIAGTSSGVPPGPVAAAGPWEENYLNDAPDALTALHGLNELNAYRRVVHYSVQPSTVENLLNDGTSQWLPAVEVVLTRADGQVLRGKFALEYWTYNAAALESIQKEGGESLPGINVVKLGAGTDVFEGSAGRDVVDGGDDVDRIEGAGGEDILSGGAGGDFVTGGAYSDVLYGGGGDDQLFGDYPDYADGTPSLSAQLSGDDEVYGDGGNDILRGSAGSDRLFGGNDQDSLYGGAGNDVLTGGQGGDRLDGGAGDDRYVFNLGDSGGVGSNAQTDVIENPQGTDTLVFGEGINEASISFGTAGDADYGRVLRYGDAGDAIRFANSIHQGSFKLEFGGGGTIDWGRFLAERYEQTVNLATDHAGTAVNGGAMNDVLAATGGQATLQGGRGDDALTSHMGGNTFVFAAGDGADTVHSQYSSAAKQDTVLFRSGISAADLTLARSGADLVITRTGTTDAVRVAGYYGGSVALEIAFDDGSRLRAADIATLTGQPIQIAPAFAFGPGNDTQTLSDGDDVASALAGDDRVLAGAGDDTVAGDAGSDTLSGEAGNDVLSGGAGHDTLDGGKGNDRLAGGSGRDELRGDTGADTYEFGRGDGSDIIFDAYEAGAPNLVRLRDLNRSDVAFYRDGADVVVVSQVSGDTLRLANQALNPASDNCAISQLQFADGTSMTPTQIIAALSAVTAAPGYGYQLVEGTVGADYMTGPGGDTTYTVNHVGDRVSEPNNLDWVSFGQPRPQIDRVFSSVTFELPDNVETLVLLGSDAIDGTGNRLDNDLVGNSAANVLIGEDGNDTLDGKEGADRMEGGRGNDTYYVDQSADMIVESAGGGIDDVYTSVSYVLPDHVEEAEIVSASSVTLTGNALNNVLVSAGRVDFGSTANNEIRAGAGDDKIFINRNLAADRFYGGTGNDTYVYKGDVGDSFSSGGHHALPPLDATPQSIVEEIGQGNDTLLTNYYFVRLPDNVETLRLEDPILLTSASSGGIGGGGDPRPRYFGNAVGNVIDLSAIDASRSPRTLIDSVGGILVDGGAGADVMIGTRHNEQYIVDNAGDRIVEAVGSTSIDTVHASVSFALSDRVENITLTGTGAIDATGNTLANILVGNANRNTLSGGDGDDTYRITMSAFDTIVDSGGNDRLDFATALPGVTPSSVVFSRNGTDLHLDYAGTGLRIAGALNADGTVNAANAIERFEFQGGVSLTMADVLARLVTGNQSLSGTAGDDILSAGAGNDVLDGGAGNDQLFGGFGADTLRGGIGDDIYAVDQAGDAVAENANSGNDSVSSWISYTLPDEVESLALKGVESLAATGNALANTLTGNEAANAMTGAGGNDTLYGGAGYDSYHYAVGDGTDTIDDADGTFAFANSFGTSYYIGGRVVFAAGIASSDVEVVRTAQGHELRLAMGGTIKLAGRTVPDVQFADGTVWNAAAIYPNARYAASDVSETIEGTAGNDVIDALGGDDTVFGRAGGDTLRGGSGNDMLYGEADNDVLDGGAGSDWLEGGAGVDSMAGGTGDDSYVVDNNADTVSEGANEGTDTVRSSVAFSLGANVEHLVLIGTDAINGTGNTLNNMLIGNGAANTLTGGSGDDSLDGFEGADTLVGGSGDDTYYVDNAADAVIEAAGEGNDRVWSSVNYALTSTVEHLSLAGAAAIDGTGNALDNTIWGNAAANTLDGGSGNDSLYGQDGTDTLIGGTGADQFSGGRGDDLIQDDGNGGVFYYDIDDGADVIDNRAISGPATGRLSLAAGIAATEVTLSRGIGAQADDLLISVAGGAPIVVRSHFANLGATRSAGLSAISFGNGTQWNRNQIDAAAGVLPPSPPPSPPATIPPPPPVSSTIEGTDFGDWLDGDAAGQAIYGYDGDDVVSGYGGNDYLNGGGGYDILYGYDGDDYIDGAATGPDPYYGDALVGGDGNDTLVSNGGGAVFQFGDSSGDDVIYNFASGVEARGHLEVYGVGKSAPGDVVLTRGSAASTNDLVVTFTGNADRIVVKDHFLLENGVRTRGVSLLRIGDNTYWDRATIDANAVLYVPPPPPTTGSDNLVGTPQSDTVDALAGDDIVYGRGGNDALLGGDGDDQLYGEDGDDRLDGGAGADQMSGGSGNDIYVVDAVGDIVSEVPGSGVDNVESSVSFALPTEVENLTLTGTANIDATGNDAANVINGNAGNNRINGGAGGDTMVGGAGDDTYVVDSISDVVTEAASAGTDGVESSITYTLGTNLEHLTLTSTAAINATGNTLANTLIGNSAANTLNGGSGADTMRGGAGNDTYVVDNTGDGVVENAGEGIDLVQSSVTYSLSADVENLTLTGTGNINATGNALANTLTGNSGTNTLNGGAGSDSMSGGGGNDIYVVDDAGDVVTEAASAGTDRVDASISYVLGANVENLTLTGTGNINGTGNALANTINGNAGNNRLDGGAGNDTMAGGAGDDTYVVDSTSDVVTEGASAGTDLVESSATFTLGNNIEYLTLTGTGAVDGTGNTLANYLKGSSGNNTLNGGGGNDVLQGGAGADTLTDTSGRGVHDGGDGNDAATGGTDRQFFAGGLGADTLTLGGGADLIAFNRGHGADVINAPTSTSGQGETNDTLSLAGVRYSELRLARSGNDLFVKIAGTADSMRFVDWYAVAGNKTVSNLQVIVDSTADYNSASTDPLLNKRVVRFNFASILTAFDAAYTANPAIGDWAIPTATLTTARTAGSDTDAIGGQLAYRYGRDGNLAGLDFATALTVLGNTNFGTGAQTIGSGATSGGVRLTRVAWTAPINDAQVSNELNSASELVSQGEEDMNSLKYRVSMTEQDIDRVRAPWHSRRVFDAAELPAVRALPRGFSTAKLGFGTYLPVPVAYQWNPDEHVRLPRQIAGAPIDAAKGAALDAWPSPKLMPIPGLQSPLPVNAGPVSRSPLLDDTPEPMDEPVHVLPAHQVLAVDGPPEAVEVCEEGADQVATIGPVARSAPVGAEYFDEQVRHGLVARSVIVGERPVTEANAPSEFRPVQEEVGRVRLPWLSRAVIDEAMANYDGSMVRNGLAGRAEAIADVAGVSDVPALDSTTVDFTAVAQYLKDTRSPRTAQRWSNLDGLLSNHLHERSAVFGDETVPAGPTQDLRAIALVAGADQLRSGRELSRTMAR